MKLTVLQYVQKTLSEMDSDAVEGISETVEAQQVADLLEDIFFDLMGTRNWPHLRELQQLTGLADVLKPNYMKLPVDIKELIMVSYNIRKTGDTRDKMEQIHYMEPEEFLSTLVNPRKSDADNVQVVTDFSLVKLNIHDDRAPINWTSFDDVHIVFDAFDKVVDTTMQANKSQSLVYKEPSFTIEDSHVPDIPAEMVPLLLNELKARAASSLAQKQNIRAEGEVVRQRRVQSHSAFVARGGIKFQDFSRKTRKTPTLRKSSLFDKN